MSRLPRYDAVILPLVNNVACDFETYRSRLYRHPLFARHFLPGVMNKEIPSGDGSVQ